MIVRSLQFAALLFFGNAGPALLPGLSAQGVFELLVLVPFAHVASSTGALGSSSLMVSHRILLAAVSGAVVIRCCLVELMSLARPSLCTNRTDSLRRRTKIYTVGTRSAVCRRTLRRTPCPWRLFCRSASRLPIRTPGYLASARSVLMSTTSRPNLRMSA